MKEHHGGLSCRNFPQPDSFACPRYSRSFPSAAARGGRAARAVGIRNPSNSARAQRRGGHRILPRFWKSSQPKRRKNEHRFSPGSSSVTPAWVPEAGIPSRPSPSEPLRGRRTRKPPTGARSKEVRNVETQGQQYKNRFLTSHGSPPYRHAVDTIHANLPRRMLHRVSPCVYRCRPPGVQLFAPSCTSCRPC